MPCLRNDFSELRRHRLVLDRHEPRQQLQDRHVAAEAPEDRRELDAHRAAADDGDRLGHFAQADRFVARDDAPAIDLDARHAPRRRSGRDDDLLPRAQRLRLAFEHVDAAVAGQPRRAFDPVDLVLLEQEFDALRQAGDDPVLARLHLGHVDADRPLPCRHAPLFRVLNDFQRVRVLEERLGRDAAPQQTRAAERLLFFDDGHLEPELRGTDRGHVAAGAGTDDDHVIFVWHEASVRATPVAVQLSLQRGQGHERVAGGSLAGSGRPALEGSSRVHPRPQLPVLVPQLPVRFGQALEPLGHPPRSEERRGGNQEGQAGEQPMKGQQTSYLIERLATVSTA